MTSHPKVAIVVLNWNKKDYVLALLDSLQSIDYDNYEITFVDNASTDGSVESVKEKFPDIDMLVNPKNLGCGGGLNTGMKHIAERGEYKYIWLLDNDAKIETNTLQKLITAMEGDEKIGICGCALFDYYNKSFLVDCGSFVNRKAQTRGFAGEYVELPNEPFEVDFVVSASAVVRTQAVREVNFIDQRYFFEWDDIDFCISLKEKGYKVVPVPSARVYHKPFLPGERACNSYYLFRNRALFISKHLGFWEKIKAFYPVVREMAKIFTYSYLQHRRDDAKKVKFALTDFIKNRWGEREFTT
ncbi:MAG: glycosyltransferase family 2 protein, partial [Thermodesulfobacteriota bacterium]